MKLHSAIRSVLRRLWLYSEPRREALREAKHPGRGNGYACALCGQVTKKPQVDHKICLGPAPGSKNASPDCTWDAWIARLFCGEDGLSVLCSDCHLKKTALDRMKMGKRKFN